MKLDVSNSSSGGKYRKNEVSLLFPDIGTLNIHLYSQDPETFTFPGSSIYETSRKRTIFAVFHVKHCMKLWTGIHRPTNTSNNLLDLKTSKDSFFFSIFGTFDCEQSVWFQLSLNLKFLQFLTCPFLKDMNCSNEVLIKQKTEIDRDFLLLHVISKRKNWDLHLVCNIDTCMLLEIVKYTKHVAIYRIICFQNFTIYNI